MARAREMRRKKANKQRNQYGEKDSLTSKAKADYAKLTKCKLTNGFLLGHSNCLECARFEILEKKLVPSKVGWKNESVSFGTN